MKKIDRLIQLNQNLDGIIQFAYGDDDTGGRAGYAIAGGTAGVGGTLLHQAIQKKRAAMSPQLALPGFEGVEKAGYGTAAKSVGSDAWSAVKNLFSKIKTPVPA